MKFFWLFYYHIIIVLGVYNKICKQKCLQFILVKLTSSITLLYSSSLIPRMFQQVSFFHFHTWVHNISTFFTLIHPFFISHPLVPAPRQDLFFYLPILCIWKKTFVCLRYLYRCSPSYVDIRSRANTKRGLYLYQKIKARDTQGRYEDR
jgi:hypothetical protein